MCSFLIHFFDSLNINSYRNPPMVFSFSSHIHTHTLTHTHTHILKHTHTFTHTRTDSLVFLLHYWFEHVVLTYTHTHLFKFTHTYTLTHFTTRGFDVCLESVCVCVCFCACMFLCPKGHDSTFFSLLALNCHLIMQKKRACACYASSSESFFATDGTVQT